MPTPEEMMLQDLKARYDTANINQEFARLYEEGSSTGRMFASFHQRLNTHFAFMNHKARVNRHFNAEDSRQLLDLIDEINDAIGLLGEAGVKVSICDEYQQMLDRCEGFLVRSGGSSIPDECSKIAMVRYKPVFTVADTHVRLKQRGTSYSLKMIGEGSFAIVYKYIDQDYGVPFALKRAKRGNGPTDLVRLRKEYDLLKELRFPHVLQVYRFDDERNEYTMEYCDSTLHDYIATNNTTLTFGARKRIALQFLFGLNYLHSKRHLHRDISYRNVLVKLYDGGAVMVKLSDFGLYKEAGSELTRTESELRGTILDPTLRSFKDYSIANEVYSIGFVLSFIFSGRKDITACSGAVRAVIDRCVSLDHKARFSDVLSIIRDIEAIQHSSTFGC